MICRDDSSARIDADPIRAARARNSNVRLNSFDYTGFCGFTFDLCSSLRVENGLQNTKKQEIPTHISNVTANHLCVIFTDTADLELQ